MSSQPYPPSSCPFLPTPLRSAAAAGTKSFWRDWPTSLPRYRAGSEATTSPRLSFRRRLLPGPDLHGLRPQTWAENEAGRHSPLGSTGKLERMGHWSCDTPKPKASPLSELARLYRGEAFKNNTPWLIKGLGKYFPETLRNKSSEISGALEPLKGPWAAGRDAG